MHPRRRPRISAATRRKLAHRPSTELNLRESAISLIVTTLYTPHFLFWYKKLSEIIKANQEYHGRKGAAEDFGIYYCGKAWFVPYHFGFDSQSSTNILGNLSYTKTATDFEIIAIHPKYPDLEKELITITANLSELDVEHYEVKRFLAGILLFKCPYSNLKKALGDTLFKYIEEPLFQLNSSKTWNSQTELAFNTYITEHDYLIDAMCQRIMMNLISVDALKI